MKIVRSLPVAFVCLTGFMPVDALAQQAVPEAPAIWREVTGVHDLGQFGSPDPVFTRPHMPAWRTTSDGRVGVRVQDGSTGVEFGLMKPELLTQPLLTNVVTAANMHDTTMCSPAGEMMGGTTQFQGVTVAIDWVAGTGANTTHVCLWNDEVDIFSVGGYDVYKIDVVVTAKYDPSPSGPGELFVVATPIEVVVKDPKTPNAEILSVTKDGAQTMSIIWTGPGGDILGSGFEPAIAFDGRLLVLRVKSKNFTWTDPGTNIDYDTLDEVDIVYAWSEVPQVRIDATNWSEILPIAFAPYDERINASGMGLGFALEPFRDTMGNVIVSDPATHSGSFDIGGTYPWIDRKADNLWMETIRDALGVKLSSCTNNRPRLNSGQGRYPYEEVPGFAGGFDPLYIEGTENTKPHQGVSVIGKWTHGKLVQLDNLNNDMDYAVGNDGPHNPSNPACEPEIGPQRRLVELFEPLTIPGTTVTPPSILDAHTNPAAGKVMFGYGRAVANMPPEENNNANIIDSMENKLNYRRFALTTAWRDVVWHTNNSKQTDQHVFDDSLDPDALIVANMTGALEYQPTVPGVRPEFLHHTGWDGEPVNAFSLPKKLQNAATALPDRWSLPTHGDVIGNGRIEPAALGGIYGKGFWMDGSIGLEFQIPTQAGVSEVLADHDWYVGLFVDCRFHDAPGSEQERRLLRFPNGGEVRLYARQQIRIVDPVKGVVHEATLPAPISTGGAFDDLLPQGGWAHIALQLRDGGRDLEILLNGLPLSRWRSNHDAPLEITVGDFLVGADESEVGQFVGWIDDLKVLGHTVDPETACNHAGGTLVGLDAAYTGPLSSDLASRYPDWVHEKISDALEARGEEAASSYSNFYDYRNDNGNHPEALRTLIAGSNGGVTSMREPLHFPEGPLYHDEPRPFSGDNAFCLSCHSSTSAPGLGLAALSLDTTTDAVSDPRRQPVQPPKVIRGIVPAQLVDVGATPLPTTPGKNELVDPLLLPSRAAAPPVVKTFAVLDAATGEELIVKPAAPAGASTSFLLDPAVLGTDNVVFRVNLDSSLSYVFSKLVGLTQHQGYLEEKSLTGPYHFAVHLPSLLPSMSYTFSAIPENGVWREMSFTVPANSAAPRVVASYQADFQEGSPDEDWLYGWNAAGGVASVASFRSLNWNEDESKYAESGLTFGAGNLKWGHLTQGGGRPGKASAGTHVMVGYRVRYAGYYSLSGSVSSVNAPIDGFKFQAYHYEVDDQNPAPTLTPWGAPDTSSSVLFGPNPSQHQLAAVELDAGDIVWITVGGYGDGGDDKFDLDIDVLYDDATF